MSTRVAAMRWRIRAAKQLNAFICETDEDGDGVVIAVKDLLDVRGCPTTAGSVVLDKSPATTDAPLIDRLRSAGCTVIGKTNLHEWAAGPTGANVHYGPIMNPYDPARVAGGSSGGSAVAVALNMCDWALGTDTGGSIRIPAALCGVVGIKPTFGLVDTTGLFPLSQSLDTIGPLAPSVSTAQAALEMMTGMPMRSDRTNEFGEMRVAVPSGWITDLDPTMGAVWETVSKGLPVIQLPSRERFVSAILPIMQAEAAANHHDLLERHRDSYGKDVLEFIDRGFAVAAADYIAALNECKQLRTEVESAMEDWDAVILPATPCVAPPLTKTDVREQLTRFTRPFNVTGQPVAVVPARLRAELPVGLQLVGHWGKDRELGDVALAFERHLDNLDLTAGGGD